LPFQSYEAKWEYQIPELRLKGKTDSVESKVFHVPSVSQSMRILFHSCMASALAPMSTLVWPALWNDVLRVHARRPFHVMIGGIKSTMTASGLMASQSMDGYGKPSQASGVPFNEDMRALCDEYYSTTTSSGISRHRFSDANGVIPQINIWDDHDIIDGFVHTLIDSCDALCSAVLAALHTSRSFGLEKAQSVHTY